MTDERIDFLAIGDVVVDTFIELEDASVHCDVDEVNCKICMNWGDKIPFKQATDVYAVGNASNASVAASRLNLNSAIFATLGDDNSGDECVAQIKKEGVSTALINREEGVSTNHHYVLSFNAERTILVKHSEFNYQKPIFHTPIKTIYFSSIGGHDLEFHNILAESVSKMPDTKLVFQPGTFQIQLGVEKQQKLYKQTDIFVCNKEEAQIILKNNTRDIKTLVEKIHALGPKIICITDGKKGAYVYDGKKLLFAPIYPDIAPPVERTGAGDAFTSTFASCLTKGMTIEESLLRAPINSMFVVQKLGAQAGLLREEELEKYLSMAPENYKIQTL